MTADVGHIEGPARSARALLKTTSLALSIMVAGLSFTVARFGAWTPQTDIRLGWWMLALGFGLGEVFVFHVEFRREAITFSLSELALILGLFFASPQALLLGRFVGSVLVLVLHDRQPIRKVILNVVGFLAECSIAIIVFHSLPLRREVADPQSWLAALLAVATAGSIQFFVVFLAMRWHGAQLSLKRMMFANSITMVTNTALGLLAAVLIATNRAAAVLLGFVAAIVVLAYRGYASLSRRHQSLSLLYEFTRLVSGSKRPDDVLQSMLREARQLLRAENAAIAIETANGRLSLWLDGTGALTGERILPVEALKLAVAGGRAVVLSRSAKHPLDRELLRELGAKDCIIAPITEDNVNIGVLLVMDRETDVSTFEDNDGMLFETLANHASVALENGRLIERLHEQARQREHEAMHDSLTGLPNRAHFHQELNAAIQRESADGLQLRVALLDLDHFKEVNDTLGHHHGDLLLREVARRLRCTLPISTVVARLGGDEFALLSFDLSPDPKDLGRTVRRAFAEPFIVDGLAIEIGSSIGIALYPDHGTDPASLLQRADVAMYAAKAASAEGVEVYAPSRDVNTVRRLGLANDLRRAVETNELELHYQPKASLCDGRVHSVEALIRWNHPEYGMVSPDEFVPLAERTGLIQPFTHSVIRQGLTTLQGWSMDGRNLGMSINLSMRNLLDLSLPARVARLLDATHVDPSLVTFEVTETSMMAEPTKALKTMHGLADLGVRLSIDDFGTGHSSLAYLQQLPVHEVKIDRSFISPLTSRPASRAIVDSVIHLAHSLELNVVAEGVEDEATWSVLRDLGCDDVQGYFLGRPIPVSDLRIWLDQRALTGLAPASSGLRIVASNR
jgi:diguanylate cyclase (GGDEF)-like protein